jgi:hypothetical protein
VGVRSRVRSMISAGRSVSTRLPDVLGEALRIVEPERDALRHEARQEGRHDPGAAIGVEIGRRASDVLVAAANPGLERIALVAPLRHTVEDRVVAHQELDPAPCGRIGLVDGAVLKREDTHHR